MFRRLSLTIAVIVGVGAVAIALAIRHFGAVAPVVLSGGAALSIVAGGVVWLVGGAYESELGRLIARLSRAGDDGPPAGALRSRFGFVEVADTVEGSVAQLRRRVEDLAGSRRELEVQVRVAEAERQHLEAILNAITDAVIVTDAFNEIAVVNGAAARVLDFDLGAATRSPVDQVVRDPKLVNLIKDAREGDASIRRHVEHAIQDPSGDQAVYNVRLSCVAASQDGPGETAGNAGVVTVLQDVTREKEIAEAKSDFVSNVSHELRTPLSSIRAYIEMLIDGEAQTDEARAEFYNIIQGEANRLARLIDNILNISRIESGVIKVEREHIALPNLAREAVDILMPQANAKGVTLKLESCPLFFQVFADRDMVLQAMLNLVGNAIKYTPEGGRVTVSFEVDQHERTVRFSVMDTGLGVPEEALPHLFDKFYRVADHKGQAKGTGLGLNLVKHVIETVHGGQVGVTSQVGKGSTFNFSLPIAENG